MTSTWLTRHRYKLLPLGLAALLVVVAVIYRKPLIAWFSGGDPSAGEPSVPLGAGHAEHAAPKGSNTTSGTSEPPLPQQQYSEPVLTSLETAFDAYEEVRSRLAADQLEGVGERARRVATALKAAAQSSDLAPSVRETLSEGARGAETLSTATELEPARARFGELSRALVRLAASDSRLTRGRHVFQCPMAQGYQKWIQTNQDLKNPYMGQKMLQCGSETSWQDPVRGPAAAEPGPGEHGDEIAHYTCPMHPSVKQPTPGQCPICGMDLAPVTRHEVESGVIIVDAARRQLIGVKTAKVEHRQIDKTIRTVGKITYDEERLSDVSLKFKGWVKELVADTTGMRVKRGQTLFTVYSPEVYAAQEELLIARGHHHQLNLETRDAAPEPSLLDAAKQRLKLWDISSATIERVLEQGKPQRYVPIASPASGFIIEKNVVEGSTVEAGARLFRIANLDKVWILAELYEAELPLVSKGQAANVTLAYLPGKKFSGKVTFIYPYLRAETRTGQVRIELDNDEIELKPDMYATVELVASRGPRLVVPESAVIYAGPRRIVFVDLGQGKLQPKQVELGIKSGDYYEVLSGLSEGQVVVTSGNFLVAAESRLKSAEDLW